MKVIIGGRPNCQPCQWIKSAYLPEWMEKYSNVSYLDVSQESDEVLYIKGQAIKHGVRWVPFVVILDNNGDVLGVSSRTKAVLSYVEEYGIKK